MNEKKTVGSPPNQTQQVQNKQKDPHQNADDKKNQSSASLKEKLKGREQQTYAKK